MVDLFGAPLDEKVSEMLSSESTGYPKEFFKVLVAYSFEKSALELERHFLPCLHVTSVMDSFAKNNLSGENLGIFDLVQAKSSEQLLDFCDSVLFFSGFLPEIFNKKLVSKKYHEELARRGYALLDKQSAGHCFGQMSKNLERYTGALSFLRYNILPDSFLKPEKDYILH